MESYTATIYANNHVIQHHNGNNLKQLISSLLVELESCTSSSYGTIRDNKLNKVIQHYKKDSEE